MKQFIPKLIIFFFLISCHAGNKKENYYVIKDISKIINSKNDSVTKFIPIFYGDHNFILINNSKIFYHKYNTIIGCGTGKDNTKPPRLSLIPDNLTEIKLKDLEKFLNESANKKAFSGNKTIIISSPTDTIKNKALTIITKHFKANKDVLIGIRRCTEEEEYVSFAKLNNTQYNPYLTKWKIGFDHDIKPEQIIEFIPPEK